MNKELQVIIDYVEGKLDANNFRKEFNNNNKLQKLLRQKLDVKYGYLKQHDFNLYNLFKFGYDYKNENWDTVSIMYGLQCELKMYLMENKVHFSAYEKYKIDYDFLINIQPDWLDIIDDQGLFDKLLEELPKDLSKTKQIAWGKARLKELFKYDKTFPRWVQGAEWPIVNGKPLVFSHQSKEKKEDERTYYYFYDPETKEQIVVTQMY